MTFQNYYVWQDTKTCDLHREAQEQSGAYSFPSARAGSHRIPTENEIDAHTPSRLGFARFRATLERAACLCPSPHINASTAPSAQWASIYK